jgi:pimeloyl-ACP methyl ester carboxylesterase
MAVNTEPLLSLLAQRFHVFAPDRPGCGLSDAFNYRGVSLVDHAVSFIGSTLDALQLPRVAIVANSMGGWWSTHFALAHPERVSSLVLAGVPAGFANTIPMQMRWLGVPGLNALLYATIWKPTWEKTRQNFTQLQRAGLDRLPAEMVECRYLSYLLPGAATGYLTLLEQVMSLRHGFSRRYELHADHFQRLRVPTLFIYGDRDHHGSPDDAVRVCRLMSDARVEVVEGAGHVPWLAQPDRCAELAAAFVAGYV